jgi:hypothetical protein
MIQQMKTEAEIRARIDKILRLREELMSFAKSGEGRYEISTAALDGALYQLRWVIGEAN